jgi:hypothetical protein
MSVLTDILPKCERHAISVTLFFTVASILFFKGF